MRIFVALLLSILSLALPAGASASVADNDSVARARAAEYHYMQAVYLAEQERFDEAYELLEYCRAIDPSSSAVMYGLSPYYLVLDKDSLAQDALIRIVEAEPHNQYYNLALINYYNKTGDNKSAISLYEDMLEYSDEKSDIYMALYSLYTDENMTSEAVRVLEMLEKSEGKTDEITMQKLRQYMQIPDTARAVALVKELIAENPEDMRYISLLGDVYMYIGDYGKAEGLYWEALEMEPDEVVTLSSLSSLYSALGKDSLFTITTERLLKSEKLDPVNRLNTLVEYAAYKGDKDSAYVMDFFREMMQLPYDQLEISETYAQYLIYRNAPVDSIRPILEKIISIEPENTSAMLQLLTYAIADNDYEEVISLCDNAMMYIPELLELYYYKGLSCYFLDRKDECAAVYELGLSRRSDETSPDVLSTVYTVLGDVYHELGELDKCIESYDSALVYNPLNMSVLNNYAYYLALDNRELDRALDMSRKTVESEPDNPIYIDTYAWVLFLLERYEEAKAYAEKLIGLNDDMSAVEFHHCGDIFAKTGDMERAVEYWKKAVEAGDDSKILKKKIRKRKYYGNAKRK
ncbi:MAG: hypothetical protein IKL75_04725 [Bacteroidaceae bacterium]|nr:hypothetical protein [Bacteroidaceae bacterium]